MGYKKLYGDTLEIDQVLKKVNIPSTSTFNIAGTAVTASASELNILDGVTASAAELNITDGLLATTAELNTAADVSAQTETITSGAISVLKRITKIEFPGTGAATLAAPDASMLGHVKVITMTADNGDVTLALTNVNGGSAATTCTFNDVNDALVLVAGVNKWHVIAEAGVALS